jgi:hypothetical protein
VDFLIQKGISDLIPVEIGIGKKSKGQLEGAINRYNAKYGILISDSNEIRLDKRIVYLPLQFFAFA